MWISKKRWKALVKRIADLEVQVQSQYNTADVNIIDIRNKTQRALNDLSKGKRTINQIREEFGLKPVDDKELHELVVTKEFDSNTEND